MLLTEKIEDKLLYKDTVLNIDMAFDNILRLFDLVEDKDFTDYEKVDTALEMLLYEYEEIEELNPEEKYDLFSFIVKEFLGIDLEKQQEKQKTPQNGEEEPPQERTYDFKVDAERIYASFFMDYKMDLFEQQGVLHWRKFLALLNGLSKETSFMQVVDIRTMELPPANKENAKRRAEIIRLKDKYSLLTDEEKVSVMDSQFNNLGKSLARKAGEK